MVNEKVWIRFETTKKDGTVLKLRIQDAPEERLDECIDIRTKYFARDEVVHKAAGISNNPDALVGYKEYWHKVIPGHSTHICCEDNDGEEVGTIMGVSSVEITTEDFDYEGLLRLLEGEKSPKETIAMLKVFHSVAKMYSPMKEQNLDRYLNDNTIVVVPDYRGLGIAEQFLKTRRLMCAEANIPKTGGWMTGHGTQIAAARDGWETTFSVKYDDLSREHGLVFEDAPPNMLYMVAGPLKESK